METNKFEEIARSKFEESEIQPSANSWNKLDAMLEEVSPNKKGSSINWFAIAAVFIGFIVIASFIFSESDSSANSDLVIEETTNELIKTEEEFNTIDDLKENQQKELLENQDNNNGIATSISTKNNTTEEIKVVKKSNTNATQKTSIKKERVASVISVKKNLNTTIVDAENLKETIANTNNRKDVLVIKEMDKQPTGLNNSNKIIKNTEEVKTIAKTDIDALLKNAQDKLAKKTKTSQKEVDAMALLSDVETEMEKTLRDKFFYALTEGFDYVKNSIVDRGH